MVDRSSSSRAENKHFKTSAKSRKSSSASSEFDEGYRERLEGRYLGNGLEIRPPSGTHHQQPGSHLSVDTRLSELSLAESEHLIAGETARSSHHTSASSKKASQYQVEKNNCYITSPFKQGYHLPNKSPSKVVDPSVQLKKVTQDSIDRVRQQFRRPKPPPRTSGYTPRLRKAKLKTTGRPISGSGPSINQCRGIQGGVKVAGRPPPSQYYNNDVKPYARSPSIRPASPTELHRPESSIHCTSRVPSERDDDSYSDQTLSSCSDVIDSCQPRHDDNDNKENDDKTGNLDDKDDDDEKDGDDNKDCDDGKVVSVDNDRVNSDTGLYDNGSSFDTKLSDPKRLPDQYKDDLQELIDQKDDLDLEVHDETDLNGQAFSDNKTSKFGLSKDSIENAGNYCQEKDCLKKLSSDNLIDKKPNIVGKCKPFADSINGHHHDDDNDDDDENRKKTLLGSYSCSHKVPLENSNQDDNSTNSNSGSNNGNQSEMGKKNNEMKNETEMRKENSIRNDTVSNSNKKLESYEELRNNIRIRTQNNRMGVENQFRSKADTDNIEKKDGHSSSSTKLFTDTSPRYKVESCTPSYEPVNGSHVHIVDATSNSGTVTPVMTVHVRGKVENDKHQNAKEAVNSKDRESNKVESDDDFVTYDDDDDDRIPSATIWKNLDQLNLSMNASSLLTSDRNDFCSKARKVQSAGSQRHQNKEQSNSIFDPTKNNPKPRASSAKRKKTKAKVKPKEGEIDKTELLRKYLSKESRKFSAELPGYFTEQFHIIQETKKRVKITRNTKTESSSESKALVKYDGHDDQKEEYLDEDNMDKESSLYLVEVDDPSSAVFFTMDSTTNSTCDVESLSGQTDHTVDTSSDTREFSDDTGFETMPGSGLSGKRDSGSKVDSRTGMDGGIAMDMGVDDDVKNEQNGFSASHEDLEVIAKAKHLIDPKSSASLYSTCPHEPLKFTINARPPPGYLYYFAYGVDMNAKRMSLYLRREYKRRWGILFGFKLRFNKKGTSCDAGGFANVEFSPGNSVEGCIYTITDADLSMLDNCMGYPKHYCRVVLPVWMSNCHEPDQHGVAQYCVPAVIYVAQQQWVEPGKADFLDCSYSVSQCLKASDILTPNYVEYLNHLMS